MYEYKDYYSEFSGIVSNAKSAATNASSHPASSNIASQLSHVASDIDRICGSDALSGDGVVTGISSTLRAQKATINGIQSFFNSYSAAEQAYITLDEDLTKLKEEDSLFKKVSKNKPELSDFKKREFNSTTQQYDVDIDYHSYNQKMLKWKNAMSTCKSNCQNLSNQINECLNCLSSFSAAIPSSGAVKGSWNFKPVKLEKIEYDYQSSTNNVDLSYNQWIANKMENDRESYNNLAGFKDTYESADSEMIKSLVANGKIKDAEYYVEHNFKGDARVTAKQDLAQIRRKQEIADNNEVNNDIDWRPSYQKDMSYQYDEDMKTDPKNQSRTDQQLIQPDSPHEDGSQSKADESISRIEEIRNEKLENADSVLSGKSPQIATVNTKNSGLNVRSEPNGQVLESIPKGSTVRVIEDEGNGWTKVKFDNNKTGYVSSKYLKYDSAETIASSSSSSSFDTTTTVSTSGSNLRLRSGPGTGNSQIGSIPNGASVKVGATNGNWTEVEVDGKTGWVYSDYLKDNK